MVSSIAKVANHAFVRRVPVLVRTMSTFIIPEHTRVILPSCHKRNRGNSVKLKSWQERNYKRTGNVLVAWLRGRTHNTGVSDRVLFRVPCLCKRTFTISYAAIHRNETRGRAKRKKLNIGPSGYAA